MTIAVGFQCDEGIVLCADTEETAEPFKQRTRKVVLTSDPERKHLVAFAGAGSTDYILTAIEKATDGLGECSGIEKIAHHLEENLVGFFNAHLANWAYFPAAERPDVELLIGVDVKDGPCRLFYYRGTSFYSIQEKAIGIGTIVADNLIGEHNKAGNDSLADLCRLSVFVLSRAKKQVLYCGGETQMIALRRGGDYTFVDLAEIRRMESEIKAIEQACTSNLQRDLRSVVPPSLSWFPRKNY
jgi:20S proteasome alpha/beta subunit